MLADRFVLAAQQRQQAEAVLAGVVRQSGAPHVGQSPEDIGLVDQLAADTAGLDDARPAGEERDAMAAFPRVALVAAQRAAGIMAAGFQFRGSDIRRETVVAGEQNQRLAGDAGGFQRG